MQRSGLLRWILCLALLSEAWAQMAPGAGAAGKSDDGSGTALDHRTAALQRVERSLEQVQPLLEGYGYGASVVSVMVEGVGIPLPGQALLMASSLEAAAGRMNIVLLLLFVTAAAIIGDRTVGRTAEIGNRSTCSELSALPV